MRVLTWNIWDIPVAPSTKHRMHGIAQLLEKNEESLDIVALIECWLPTDREDLLKAGFKGGLEYSFFFRSGSGFPGGDGSGTLVMTRWPIRESMFYTFVGGKAQKLLHWDYSQYSGKGIGLVQIEAPHGSIDVYVSHFVAYYTPRPEDPDHDEYVFHRHLAAFDASKFIKLTKRPDSLALYMVDLNASPTSLPYRVMSQSTPLRDSWKDCGRVRYDFKDDPVEKKGFTINYPGNCYSNNWATREEPSERIDYVFYSNAGSLYSPKWCERRHTCPETISNIDYPSLSDHAALLVHFEVGTTVGVAGKVENDQILTQLELSGESALVNIKKRRRFKLNVMYMLVLCFILLVSMAPFGMIYTTGITISSVGSFMFFIMANVFIPIEEQKFLDMLSSLKLIKKQTP